MLHKTTADLLAAKPDSWIIVIAMQSEKVMAEPVTIPISIFELNIKYEIPAIRMLTVDRVALVQELFDSFHECGPTIDDLEPVTTGKTSEQGIRFKLPAERITMFVGAASCKFIKDGTVWQDADRILKMLSTFLNVVTKFSGVTLGMKSSVLSLHLQPKNVSFRDVLKPFIDSRLKALDGDALKSMAIVANWPKRRITLDGSAQLANGIYLQLERDFPADMDMDDAKEHVYNDEVEMLKLLGVAEVDD